MTKEEWDQSNDAGAMLDFIWQQRPVSGNRILLEYGLRMKGPVADRQADEAFDRAMHRFYLACCRRIWKLLPQEESRRGVELGEKYLAGAVSGDELHAYNWHVEGAAFTIDYNSDPAAVERWVTELTAMPRVELAAMLHPPDAAWKIEPRELLKRAAYFVDYAMIYPGLRPKAPPPESYRVFLDATELRRYVEHPGPSRQER